MPIMLKALNVRNVGVLTELRTTDCWIGATRPIPSLILLERLLQLVCSGQANHSIIASPNGGSQ